MRERNRNLTILFMCVNKMIITQNTINSFAIGELGNDIHGVKKKG